MRGRDFRKDLEERERLAVRERNKEKGSRYTSEQPKRPRLDQPPPSNLDADDPVDDDDDDDSEERWYSLIKSKPFLIDSNLLDTEISSVTENTIDPIETIPLSIKFPTLGFVT